MFQDKKGPLMYTNVAFCFAERQPYYIANIIKE